MYGTEGPIAKPRLVAIDAVMLLLQLLMLSLEISKQQLQPEMSEEEEAVGPAPPQDIENAERGEIRVPPPPPLSDTFHDTHSNDGDQQRAAELERQVFEVTSGEFMVARLDIAAVVERLWADSGQDPRARARGGVRHGWRYSVGGNRSW